MRESDICLLRRDGLSIKRRQERSSGQSRLGHRPVNNRWPLSSKVLCEASSQTQIARPQEILCIDQLTETFAVKKKKSTKSSRCRSEMFPRRTLAATSSSLWRYNCYHYWVLDEESVDSKVLVPSNKFRCKNEPFDCSKDQERTIYGGTNYWICMVLIGHTWGRPISTTLNLCPKPNNVGRGSLFVLKEGGGVWV